MSIIFSDRPSNTAQKLHQSCSQSISNHMAHRNFILRSLPSSKSVFSHFRGSRQLGVHNDSAARGDHMLKTANQASGFNREKNANCPWHYHGILEVLSYISVIGISEAGFLRMHGRSEDAFAQITLESFSNFTLATVKQQSAETNLNLTRFELRICHFDRAVFDPHNWTNPDKVRR
jgi:hypothetical protein